MAGKYFLVNRIENNEEYHEISGYRTYSDTTYTDYADYSETNQFSRKYQSNLQFNYYRVLNSNWQLEAERVYKNYQLDVDADYTYIQMRADSPDTTWTKSEFEVKGYDHQFDYSLNLTYYLF